MSIDPPTEADVARGRALGLPDRCDFTLLHCDRPMRWKGGRTSWTGPPNLGHEHNDVDYACDECGAQVRVNVSEIS